MVQTKEWTASTWEAVKAATQLDSAAGGIEGHFATIGEGIGRALEKGDAKGAIKIFTTSIELQFRILVADIADLWNGFAGRFVDTFKDAATAVRLELIDLAAEAQKKLTTTSTGQQITAFSGELYKRFGAGLIRGGQFLGSDFFIDQGKEAFTKGQAAVNSTVLGQELGPDAARAALENERKAAQERAIRERADQQARDLAAREEFRRQKQEELDRARRDHIRALLDANRAAEIAPTPRQVLSNVAPQIAALATSARGQFGGALASASLGGGSVPEQILRENKKGNDLQKEGNTKLEAVRDEIERLRNQSFPAFTVTG